VGVPFGVRVGVPFGVRLPPLLFYRSGVPGLRREVSSKGLRSKRRTEPCMFQVVVSLPTNVLLLLAV
jgi:hypothetical protein